MLSLEHGLFNEHLKLLYPICLICRVEKLNKTKNSFIKPKWNQRRIELNSFFASSSLVIVWCFKHFKPSQEAWRVGRLEEKLSALQKKRPAIQIPFYKDGIKFPTNKRWKRWLVKRFVMFHKWFKTTMTSLEYLLKLL